MYEGKCRLREYLQTIPSDSDFRFVVYWYHRQRHRRFHIVTDAEWRIHPSVRMIGIKNTAEHGRNIA